MLSVCFDMFSGRVCDATGGNSYVRAGWLSSAACTCAGGAATAMTTLADAALAWREGVDDDTDDASEGNVDAVDVTAVTVVVVVIAVAVGVVVVVVAEYCASVWRSLSPSPLLFSAVSARMPRRWRRRRKRRLRVKVSSLSPLSSALMSDNERESETERGIERKMDGDEGRGVRCQEM